MNLFSPKRCLICHGEIEAEISWRSIFLNRTKEEAVCRKCESMLLPIEGEKCTVCGRELDLSFCEGSLCLDCIRWEKDESWRGCLEKNISLYHYNDFMKEVIARFKFRGDYCLASVFAGKLRSVLKGIPGDYIVPIPLSAERLYERGFNQSEALIVGAGLKPVPLLARIHSEKQSKKTRRDRIHLPQVFRLESQEKLTGKNIVLVDDIYTTGSTLRHAARILKEAGADKVSSLTIAR
ncbi:ComF family protein [Mesobacillus zeae]|uniref:ComF family protein n=1 Tax=Mesobacillus zeae TaxID=1917180 RepID=A0A398B5N1_9BACI|nr:ComF family protein [Mesobacillus zeae]RID84861.1 ComF family protein [Mesobacillus zeae]